MRDRFVLPWNIILYWVGHAASFVIETRGELELSIRSSVQSTWCRSSYWAGRSAYN